MDDIHRRFNISCKIKILLFLATFLYSVHLKLFLSLELGTEKNETFSHLEVLVGVAELLLADTQLYSGSLVCQDVAFVFPFLLVRNIFLCA